MFEPAPFSDDFLSNNIRNELKNWKPKKLINFRSENEINGPRIYTDGVYDLFHNGHTSQLRQAKTAFSNTYLIVGVCSDEDVIRFKGTRPVMTQFERYEIVRQCRYVDEVYTNPPFYPTLEFVNSIKADLVAHDSLPYSSPETVDCYSIFKESDRFLTTQRTSTVSTTKLLARIFENLEMFKKREEIRKNLLLN